MGEPRHDRVRIRNTHPALYRSIMTFSIMSVALAWNFWRSNPTFNPYGIDKDLVGGIFCLLGLWQGFFLNVVLNLRLLRLGQAGSLFVMLVWGLSNTQQSFAGNASFQLPILYVALAVLQALVLIEPPVNLTTQRDRTVVVVTEDLWEEPHES